MTNKNYTSYEQIDRELEILKIEKEISYHKLVSGVQKTKDSLTSKNIVTDLLSTYSSSIPYGAIISTAVPFVLNRALPFVKNWFKRKRGN
ncbi:hypothetical protein SAMN05444396_103338 [Flavobacterium segetis]|uniref:Uncharacterized protein n=1 Tax=Flavobacterium segetis TaxID=271157 RepID=A0A1M5G7R8_9FLAO|nr:DUF6327 family protein [Flavobacterium segetis]SHF99870.1 hypothetical protein SAMN05444396_103338 [Flavobacterium segetis]